MILLHLIELKSKVEVEIEVELLVVHLYSWCLDLEGFEMKMQEVEKEQSLSEVLSWFGRWKVCLWELPCFELIPELFAVWFEGMHV